MIKDFSEIFNLLKEKISHFAPPLTVVKNDEKEYGAYSFKKNMEFAGRSFDRLCFATLIIHKNYVTLYFFPAYTHPKVFENIPAEIKKLHKGKSCFNIKQMDDLILLQFDRMLKDGYDLYSKGNMIPVL